MSQVDTYPGTTNELIPPGDLALIDKAVGWPQPAIAQAVAIEENQSSGNTAAFNPTDPDGGSIGTFQINGGDFQGGLTPALAVELSNPIANAKEALSLYEDRGWQPWQGDPSLAPPYQNLSVGQQAAASVANTTEVEAKAKAGSGESIGWQEAGAPYVDVRAGASAIGDGAKAAVDLATGNLGAAASAANAASGGGLSSAGSAIWGYVLKGIGALAGVGLIVLALKEAGNADKPAGDEHPARDLATAAAA